MLNKIVNMPIRWKITGLAFGIVLFTLVIIGIILGVQSFVEALRVQNHEYSNKLHTIAGLIQLDGMVQGWFAGATANWIVRILLLAASISLNKCEYTF